MSHPKAIIHLRESFPWCVYIRVIFTDAEYKKESASLKLKVLELQRPDMNEIAHHNA